jgi:hypothetical protein
VCGLVYGAHVSVTRSRGTARRGHVSAELQHMGLCPGDCVPTVVLRHEEHTDRHGCDRRVRGPRGLLSLLGGRLSRPVGRWNVNGRTK